VSVGAGGYGRCMQTLPFGSWPTPITSEQVVATAARLGEVAVAPDGVWWAEARATEGGRTVLVHRSPDGTTTDLLPAPWNARTRVHEYGGGSWAVADGQVFFTDFGDQRLYRVVPGGEPEALTAEPELPAGVRFADLSVTPDGAVLCVRETHTASGDAAEVVHEVVAVAPDGEQTVLVTGPDFVSDPRRGPDGSLCWLQWQHPDMPWDAAELVVRSPDGVETVVAGGRSGTRPESVVQPSWAADGSLLFFADRTDTWSLFRWRGGEPELVLDPGSDMAGPQWVFGASRYAELPDGRLVVAYGRDGADRLAVLEPGGPRELETRYASFAQLRADGTGVVCVAGGPTTKAVVARVDVDSGEVTELRPAPQDVDAAWFSRPRHVTFPSTTIGGTSQAHALVYPPTNPEVAGPDGELPPLVVVVHGGPTAAASPVLTLGVQYWTSRGFAVADVDYRGSTGYGRVYRDALQGSWGIADLDDVAAVVAYLSSADAPAQLRVDPARAVIRGGSAGGYTTLAALTFRPGVFAAGASHYGVADLAALAADTHSFESRYLDGLIAPWPSGEAVYTARSPIHHVDALDTPLAVFQGDEDRIVPPEQAEVMVAALREKGVPHAYLLFPGEQHGFRKAENIRASLDGELSFYAQVLGFELPESEGITPIAVVTR